MITIRCTYPHKDLSPNTMLHWRPRHKAKAAFKNTWHYELLRYEQALAGVTEFKISFAPPNKRRRDVDNAIASCKSLIDALSGVVGVDDSQFKITYPRAFSEPVAGGAVFIEFQSLARAA